MFIIENNKITSEKMVQILDVSLPVTLDFQFKDAENLEDEKFKLIIDDIEANKYMTDDNTVSFRYIDLSEKLKKQNQELSIKIMQDDIIILDDSITFSLIGDVPEGGGDGEELEGVFCDAFPTTSATKIKFSDGFTEDRKYFDYMFSSYSSLVSVQGLNTANGTNFKSMFNGCYKLISIPELNTANGTNFQSMFYRCYALTNIPELNTANGTDFGYMFQNCTELQNFGGLKNVKYSFSLSASNKLTHESLLNVLNGLFDLTGSDQQTLTLGSTNLAKLTDDEKAIATNKNWILA